MLKEQLYAFLISMVCGVLSAIVYDVFRAKRRALRTKSLIVGIEDLLFWIAAAIAIFLTILYANNGLTRGFVFLGIVLGAVLYGVFLSKAVLLLMYRLFKMIACVIKLAFKILFWPVKQICIILTYPLKLIYRLLRKIVRYLLSVVKRWMAKLSPIRAIKRKIARKVRKRKRGRMQHGQTV